MHWWNRGRYKIVALSGSVYRLGLSCHRPSHNRWEIFFLVQNNFQSDCSIHGFTIGGISAVIFVLHSWFIHESYYLSSLSILFAWFTKMFQNLTFIKLCNSMKLIIKYALNKLTSLRIDVSMKQWQLSWSQYWPPDRLGSCIWVGGNLRVVSKVLWLSPLVLSTLLCIGS